MAAARNPFEPISEAGAPSPHDEPAFQIFAVRYAAASIWDLLGDLPNKAEATLAQRRLEETVFWATRAAEPAPQRS
ncbi:hypothetical protein [Methylopila sp. M107]|uniref:Acb2/Tad1 domain-containing protein n=1 Tax=Methylopila sp. M107 TaxID=1101190 RepID=UPI00035F1CE0|nr:hypothetical protein [Methylopila sp. M107]